MMRPELPLMLCPCCDFKGRPVITCTPHLDFQYTCNECGYVLGLMRLERIKQRGWLWCVLMSALAKLMSIGNAASHDARRFSKCKRCSKRQEKSVTFTDSETLYTCNLCGFCERELNRESKH